MWKTTVLIFWFCKYSSLHASPPPNKVFPGWSSNGFFHTLYQILQLMWHFVSFTFVAWLFYNSSVLSFHGRRYLGLLPHVPNISQFHNHIISYHFLGPFQIFLRHNFRIPLTSHSNLDELLSRNAPRLTSCPHWDPRLVPPFLPSQTLHLTLSQLEHIFKYILKTES